MKNEIHYSNYHEVIAWELRASLRRYHEKWEELLWEKPPEHGIYLSVIEQYRLSVVILSCTLLEATINFYIGTKCSAKRFKELQGNTLFDKWAKVPKEFVPAYSVNKDCGDDLKKLILRRNVIIHHKPFISIDGDNRHNGNEPDVAFDEHHFICQSVTLPYRLVQNLLEADPDDFPTLSCLHSACAPVAADCAGARRRQELDAKVPRQLIVEIMEQGHDRETATLCAAMIGNKPRFNAAGNIEFLLGLGKKVEIRPLKFFAGK